jgi:hypothetical protein
MTEPKIVPDALTDEGDEVFILADGVDLVDPEIGTPIGNPIDLGKQEGG